MASISPTPKLQFFAANGTPLVGGKLYSYAAGTTTPLATYTDAGGGTANPNPVILDSRGEASVWLSTDLYKLRLTTATDVDVWTVDNVGGNVTLNQLAASGGAALIGFLQAGANAQPRTVQSKLRDTIHVKDFGAVGNGSTDDTSAIQTAMDAASAAGLPLEFAGATYAVSATTAFALTAPATLTMIGVAGKTVIKLISTTVDTHIIGRSSASTYFQMEGITLDGNRSVITTRNTGGLYFGNAQTVISRGNIYKDLNDLGVYASKAIYVEAPTLGEYAESTGDQYLNCEGYPFQTYRIARNIVQDAYCTGALTSFTDINGQFIPSTVYAKTRVSNNVVVCDASFPLGFSVLSLMGNDIECVGNKVSGGDVQIVVHTGTTDLLYNYLISGNFLWSAKANAITVNQTSGTSASNRNIVISGNMIYQPAKDGIAIIGTYAGGATTPQASVAITGNVIYDYLTNNPAPGAFACIRTLGTVNATITGNSIAGPRWAGIYCEYDGRSIVISNNVIADHQGRTTTAPQHGGAIFIGASNATAYLGNISIDGNLIRNYCSTVSPASTSIRTGGIVINEAKAQDISVRNNRIQKGEASGISLYNCVNVTASGNEVAGFGSGTTALNTASGVGSGCELAYAISGPTYATTANRPTLQSTQAGYSMWDSTINEPIWWNGTVWKDADNNTV